MNEKAVREMGERVSKEIEKFGIHGTNLKLNNDDKFGDGDQSLLTGLNLFEQQIYRDLWADGEGIGYYYFSHIALPFTAYCYNGHVENVKSILKAVDNDPVRPSEKLMQLLERRESAMRMTPLLLVTAISKIMKQRKESTKEIEKGQLEVAKLLLQYGARVDAKDICGKTVVHYGAGCAATPLTLEIADMCIIAHESSHLFGKEVELYGLQNNSMNGKRGVCRGFQVDTGRRAVYLFDQKKQIAVKPENMRLLDPKDASLSKRRCLIDIQDRLGQVVLLELFMSNRIDVAKFLLEKYDVSVDIEDITGHSPLSMACRNGTMVLPEISNLIMKKSMSKALKARKMCGNCMTLETDESCHLACSGCHAVYYCSKDCQKKDWKNGGHKERCAQVARQLKKTVQLEKPRPDEDQQLALMDNVTKEYYVSDANNRYKKPGNVIFEEKFCVKIQVNDYRDKLLIYDKTRQCCFHYYPGKRGFKDMLEKVLAEKAVKGRKTYMKASFSKEGVMTMYLGETTLELW